MQVAQEVDVFFVDGGSADVAARVEAPALFPDLDAGGDLAQAAGEVLLKEFVTAVNSLDVLAAIESHDVGNELDLFRGEVTVGTVDLMEDVPGVDEEHSVFPCSAQLRFVKEPQRHRQGDCVEEVRPDGHHHVNCARLDEPLSNVLLRMPGVTRGVGHDRSGAAFGRESGLELLDPDEVAVVGLVQTEGETLVACELLILDLVDVERRIGHDEVE